MRRTFVAVAVAFVGLVLIACSAGEESDPGRPAGTAPAANQETEEPGGQSFFDLKPKDIELTIKTLEKQCFGTAGCNITFRVEFAFTTTGVTLDPSKTYEVTYEILGGEDPYINTLTVTGDQYSTDEDEFIGTASSNSELEVKVTDVSEF